MQSLLTLWARCSLYKTDHKKALRDIMLYTPISITGVSLLASVQKLILLLPEL